MEIPAKQTVNIVPVCPAIQKGEPTWQIRISQQDKWDTNRQVHDSSLKRCKIVTTTTLFSINPISEMTPRTEIAATSPSWTVCPIFIDLQASYFIKFCVQNVSFLFVESSVKGSVERSVESFLLNCSKSGLSEIHIVSIERVQRIEEKDFSMYSCQVGSN